MTDAALTQSGRTQTALTQAAPTDAADWTPDLAQGAGPKYAAIADRLAADVRDGRLPVGAKLPPQRELAWRLGVTVGTVTRAYQEAERRGLVGGEVGRGTFVRPRAARFQAMMREPAVDGPGPGPFWEAGDTQIQEAVEGPEIGPIPMQSNVPPPASDAELFRSTLAAMAAAPNLGDLLNYHSIQRTARFRRAGVDWLARRGVEASTEDLALTAGAHNGLMATFATLLKPGQKVLGEALTYAGIKTIAKLLDLELVPGAMDADGLTAEAVAEAASAGRIDAVYIVPTLQNPTNAIMPEARRIEIAQLCERYEIPVIEDDICGLFPRTAPAPLTRHAPSVGYLVTSLSKTLAPGLRIGFVKTPKRMRDFVAASVRASTWMASPVTAEIAARWIESDGADALLAERRAALARRHALAAEIFDGQRYAMPEGALHLWLTLPPHWRASQFVAAAAAQDVVLTAAHAFTIGDAPSPGAVRVCLGGPRTEERLVEGLTRLRRILDDQDPLAEAEVM